VLFLKLSKFRINKIKASVLVILIVASAFVSLSGFFHFASAKSASGSPQPLGLTLVVTPANHPLVIGETLGLRADVVVPTHNKSETTHSKVVSDYDASAFTFVWQTEQSSSASSVDSWNLTSTGVNADFQFTKLTAEPLNVTVSVVYGSQGVIALSSIQVVPASQPKTLQVSIVTPLGNDPKLSVNQVLDCSANVTALNQFGNETFMVSLSDALFTYTITAHNTTVLSVNGLQSTFEAYQPVTLASSNGILSLAYASASEAEVWVHLQVIGNNQSSLLFNQTAGYTLVVTDPYTSPFMYFVASTATASYIITTDGLGWYQAVNGTDGSISWSSTNQTIVIQNAINGLTVGRTWQETIILKGDLGTTVGNITVANYTAIIGDEAKLMLASGGFAVFIQPPSDLTKFTLSGVNFTSAQAGNGYGLYFFIYDGTWRAVENGLIEKNEFNNFAVGIDIIAGRGNSGEAVVSKSVLIKQNSFVNCSGIAGLEIEAGYNADVSNNNFIMLATGQLGMFCEDGGGNSFHDNFVSGIGGANTDRGFAIAYQNNDEIYGNYFGYLGGAAIDVGYATRPVNDIIISGNNFDHCQGPVIALGRYNINGYVKGFQIIGNNFYTSGYMFFAGNGPNTGIVMNNWFNGYGSPYLAYITGTEYNITIKNNYYEGISAPVFGTGTLVISGNTGFVTENSFSGTSTASTAVLNHGLASNATYVWVSFDTSAITGYTWTSTSTQVTITPTGTLPESWTCYVKAEYKP
jgi:hypothetical protein